MQHIRDWVSPQGIMRLLVLSYFIAASLGWVGDALVIDFMIPLLPADVAVRVMQGLTLALAALILIGFGRKPAALVLALVVFFSSYTALYAGGDISAFWRDLALIGALLMTADFASQNTPEEAWPDETSQPAAESVTSMPVRPLTRPTEDCAYREDFDIARAN